MVTPKRLIAAVIATTVAATLGCSSSTTPDGTGSGSGSSDKSSSSSASGGGGACYTITGSGASEACQYDSSDEPGFTCASAESKAGSCPSSGLQGCCVITTTIDGFKSVGAQCYYNETTADAAQPTCTGSAGTWSTTAP